MNLNIVFLTRQNQHTSVWVEWKINHIIRQRHFYFSCFLVSLHLGGALLSVLWKKWFFTKYHFFFGLEFASIYLKYCLLDISNDEIWRLRAHRLVLGMTSSTQNSWRFSTVLWILGSRSHDNDQYMSTKSLEFVVWDI